ncbi:MAG: hypothetical protein AAFN79_00710 [Pseudomonadota bacterium]
MTRKFALAAALLASIAIGGAAQAQDAKTDRAVEALRAVIANPNAPVDPILSEFSFNEALYLVDELNGTQQRQLARIVREFGVRFPSGVDTAIRAKGGRSSNNP